jgi:hypothetical protein
MGAYSYSNIDRLATPAGDISFNDDAGDTLWIDPTRSTGLGASVVRNPVDAKGQADGELLHDFFLRGQHLALSGDVLIRSAATDPSYVAARDALLVDTRTKCKSILRATGTLHFTTGETITGVKCELLPDARSDRPEGPSQKSFLIGLATGTAA